MTIHDIKDKTPNEATIKILEDMLKDARSGDLRTVICLTGWDDDSWHHNWSVDDRNTHRRMIGELTMLHADMVNNVAIGDGDSILAMNFEDD